MITCSLFVPIMLRKSMQIRSVSGMLVSNVGSASLMKVR